MFGLAAYDEGGPGSVKASVRTVTNARQVGMRMQRKCTGTHRHARVGANNTSETMEHRGTWVHQVARLMEEQLREDKQELKTQEQKKSTDATRIRGTVHEKEKRRNKSRARWKDVIGMTTKAGDLTLSCALRQDVSRWSTFVATRCTQECPERRAT